MAFVQGLGILPPRLIVPSFRGLYDQLQAQKSPRPPSIMVDQPQSTSCHRQDPLLRPAELVLRADFFSACGFFLPKGLQLRYEESDDKNSPIWTRHLFSHAHKNSRIFVSHALPSASLHSHAILLPGSPRLRSAIKHDSMTCSFWAFSVCYCKYPKSRLERGQR